MYLTSFVTLATLFTAVSACTVDDDHIDDEEVGQLDDDGPPSQSELDGYGKADWFGISSPETWRRFWYASYYWNIKKPIEGGSARPAHAGSRTVLLVPGTTIGPEFYEPMVARLRRDGFDPIVWAPPDLFTESLETGAARIGAKVQSVLASRGITKLSIVAECDGGVAARFFAQVRGGHQYLDQLVTFVSAHHGSTAAPVGSWVTGWQALQDIKPNSPFMKKLNTAPMPAGLKLTSIYTCHDEFLWPYTTSRVDGAANVEFCRNVVGHFDGFWNATMYERILVTLRGEGSTASLWY
jgi:hypothetical protein